MFDLLLGRAMEPLRAAEGFQPPLGVLGHPSNGGVKEGYLLCKLSFLYYLRIIQTEHYIFCFLDHVSVIKSMDLLHIPFYSHS